MGQEELTLRPHGHYVVQAILKYSVLISSVLFLLYRIPREPLAAYTCLAWQDSAMQEERLPYACQLEWATLLCMVSSDLVFVLALETSDFPVG